MAQEICLESKLAAQWLQAWIKNLDWKLSAASQTPKTRKLCDRFAVWRCENRFQPISGLKIAEWRADPRKILIQIIISY